MEQNAFAQDFATLPALLPVFPLSSALLLPMGHLPLNIFEPRYKQMVEHALAGPRLIGMIQPRNPEDKTPQLLKTGCAGKIIEFAETPDGRYLIKLCGVYRFDIVAECKSDHLYRSITPDWSPYKDDATASTCLNLNRTELKDLLQAYFEKHEMQCDWGAVEGVTDGKLITCLSMVCPFNPAEKQALLEAPCCKTRAAMFMTLLELAVHARPLKSCH
jgi:Lon protease-like protein